jgi:hypothetical protein
MGRGSSRTSNGRRNAWRWSFLALAIIFGMPLWVFQDGRFAGAVACLKT